MSKIAAFWKSLKIQKAGFWKSLKIQIAGFWKSFQILVERNSRNITQKNPKYFFSEDKKYFSKKSMTILNGKTSYQYLCLLFELFL